MTAAGWTPAGPEQIHCQMPVANPTPLKAGSVVTAAFLPEAARYCVQNVECRDLDYDIPPSY